MGRLANRLLMVVTMKGCKRKGSDQAGEIGWSKVEREGPKRVDERIPTGGMMNAGTMIKVGEIKAVNDSNILLLSYLG